MIYPSFLCDDDGNSYSAFPPETYLTFSYWIYCVPQFRPKDVLILGYAGGTIAGLIHKIYGNVPIVGVDTKVFPSFYNDTVFICDAREYIKTCKKYDAVIVDLFTAEHSEPCDFVTSEEFADELGRIGNYLIINTLRDADMSIYKKKFRKMGMNSPSGSAEKIYYYETGDPIPHLHPWK
jgi:hypothetical protein